MKTLRKAEIVKLDETLTYKTLKRFTTFERAVNSLNRMAQKNNWTYRRDMSLFGGYYVTESGHCYSVR